MYFCTTEWGFNMDLKKKLLTNEMYSLDKLTMEFCIRTSDSQLLMDSYSTMTNCTQWQTNKLSVCRYNYTFNLSENNSFWVGLSPNWLFGANDGSTVGRIEFNPAKVGDDYQFISLLNKILYLCRIPIKPIKFDLAIDFPIARENMYLVKDGRKYEEYSLSSSNRTQYLGQRNTHGRIKLYNKALESKLGIPLTRLELTIDYAERSPDIIRKLLPSIHILDSYQFPADLTGTDKVLMVAILQDRSLLHELSRKKKEKLSHYLDTLQLNYSLNTDLYDSILSQIISYTELVKYN